MPIKAIRNVKTIVSDITTPECRRIVSQELSGWKADVVLCDGAPNIGSAYQKDAYVQNELALAALRTATDHLIEGGTFCTKVYRSQDYNALIWVFQQLFQDVQAMKPNSSRSQSSEIFIVCMKYTSPKFIDPKLLDPNHVFREVKDAGLNKIDVMHKKYEQHNKRHRTGYDESLGMLLTTSRSVTEFVESKDPIRMLTDVNSIEFSDKCSPYAEHPHTTDEIKLCLKDLRLLGKLDFKKLLKWRLRLRKDILRVDLPAAPAGNATETKKDRRSKDVPASEEEIQQEILAMREQMDRRKKHEKKALREKMAKARTRQALGMTSGSFAVDQDSELFSIPVEMRESHLANLTEVNLDSKEASGLVGSMSDDEDVVDGRGGKSLGAVVVGDEDLDNQLEEDYIRYLTAAQSKKKEAAGIETTTAKRKRLSQTSDAILNKNNLDDAEIAGVTAAGGIDESVAQYANILSGSGDKSDDSSEDSDDEDDVYDSDPGDAFDDNDVDNIVQQRTKKAKTSDGLLSMRESVPQSTKINKWFSHPLFKETLMTAGKRPSDAIDDSNDESESVERTVMAEMPKTDKEIRREKRKKADERKKRREDKRSRLDDDDDGEKAAGTSKKGFEIIPQSAVTTKYDENDMVIDEKTYQHRELIKKGLGKQLNVPQASENTVEIVASSNETSRKGGEDAFFDRVDQRTYDSDSEDYDNRDRAMTLAIGTMMLRKSKQKALVDASYNRFAWNDPAGLPAWFVDDEMKHNKPQLPVPGALLDQVSP